jgi:hypothetical protein
MAFKFYSYTVEKRGKKFAVICEQDGSLYGTYALKWVAEHAASEAYCDDGVIIEHESS